MAANRFLAATVVLATCWGAQNAQAGPVGPLTTFSAGTTAKASEVNGNFSAVSAAVNDNASRIMSLETSPNITGNITLVDPSTATAGSILKGTAPFIHNFGTNNTFVGVNAGNFTMTGVGNAACGINALSSNTTGIQNTASGAFALNANTDGSQNTATGNSALVSNTTGIQNTASGAFALHDNTTGNNNTASGVNALLSNTTGIQNTASGVNALLSNTTGLSNTAVGQGALKNNTSGSGNIAIGLQGGFNLTTGGNNIDIGNLGIAGEANTIRIGGTQTATFVAGIRGITTGSATAIPVLIDTNGQLGTVSSSRRFKDDLADMGEASSTLMKLRPVTFHYKNDKNPKGRTLQYGLVAEDVARVAPGLVAHSADGKIETVYYQFLAPMLLNEYQKQQRTLQAQAQELKKQTAEIAELKREAAEVAKLKEEVARMSSVLARLDRAQTIAASNR